MAYKRLSVDGYTALSYKSEFLCDSVDDIQSLPNLTEPSADGNSLQCSAGSTAITLDTQEVYMLNNQGEWVLYQSLSGGGGGGGGSDVEIATLKEFIEYLNTEAEDGGTE